MMTNLDDGWFDFAVMNNDYPDEFCAPITFTINLDEIPESMNINEFKGGYYLDQIKWSISSFNSAAGTPYEIIVDIHGDINPTYNAALVSLFGDDVGETLLMKSEAYITARGSNLIKARSQEEDYRGGLTIVSDIVDELADEKFTEQVFGRLMANTTFI